MSGLSDALANISSTNWYIQLMIFVNQVVNQGQQAGSYNINNILQLFLWFGVYKTSKIRVVGTMSSQNLILMTGALVAMLSKLILVCIEIMYKNDAIKELSVTSAFLPLTSIFEAVSMSCICYYALITVNMWSKVTKYINQVIAFVILLIFCSLYFTGMFDACAGKVITSIKCTSDLCVNSIYFQSISYTTISLYCFLVLIAFNLKFKHPFKGGIYTFLFLNLIIYSEKTSAVFDSVNTDIASLMTFIHTLSIPFIQLHLIKAYTWKLNELEITKATDN